MTAVGSSCDFPLFRERYLLSDSNTPVPSNTSDAAPGPSRRAAESKQGAGRSLKVLDLRSLPRDDGPPTELRARKDKLAFFDRQCTRVGDGLFVSGETVAKSREVLRSSGITHVINCVGFLYPAYFEDELSYKVLYLQDTPAEDILCVLYDVFDFIEAAAGGNVLVHCSQGVSRSTALAIAYLMWKTGQCYDDVFSQVKAHRGVANPNIGFICQLLQWHKRRHIGVERCRMYRVAPQSASVPHYLVPRAVSSPQLGSLDPRGAFVVQGQSTVYMWEGSRCPEEFGAAATRFAQQLAKYEGVEGPVVAVSQGQESAAFWACLAGAGSGGEQSSEAASPRENPSYDKDFELYQRASGSSGGGESGDSARGGRKTPRDEARDQAHSPNERLRKQARSGADAAGPRLLEDVTTQELERGISLDSAATELEAREQRVAQHAAQRPSRLQRASSEEMSPSHHLSSPHPRQQGDAKEEASSSSGVGSLAAKPAPRPLVPPINLKLKLPGR